MGKLITENDTKGERDWYFTSECYEYINYSGPFLKWPNPCYPYHAAIDFKELEDNKVKIEIRRWIESSIDDTVITKPVDKSYRVYYGQNKCESGNKPYDMWDKSYEVRMIWLVFYFENEESLLAFTLRFGNIISEIIERKEEHLDKITENHGR